MYEQCNHISSDWTDLEIHIVSDITIVIQTWSCEDLVASESDCFERGEGDMDRRCI